MLQIKDIRKQYITGSLVQTALDGVSLTLRDHEFVAVLGPSGSGKTTLLNVIGGLDRYDSGDLIINGVSTKKYSDRDWDSYRNHTIGFVFQSYNLIPHQTVLANVELALTISGISRGERRKRATKALEDVGLGDQLHKRPNQMSGGQMQRVAIARALVNNPDILLADEPTGALDSDTSVQVMELLKEVAKDRLVVMVTHNPELAEEYASRIVRVRDGKIIDDSDPYLVNAEDLAPAVHKNMGKAKMSWFTALALSFNNLRTKKARTILTAFAGSIGIIGIALILSLSTGFQRYIDKIQEDTLANYPLMIQSETADMTSAFMAMGTVITDGMDKNDGTVLEQQMISQMFAQIGSNDLASFKKYLEGNMDQVKDAVNSVQYAYAVKPYIFGIDTSEEVTQMNPGSLFEKFMGKNMMTQYMDTDVFQEMIDDPKLLNAQYDVLRGRWPESYNEMIIVLANPGQMPDYMAYTLGLKDMDTLDEMIALMMSGQMVENVEKPMVWTYEELMSLQFKLINSADRFRYNQEYKIWEDMTSDHAFMKELVDAGETLKIVGIVCPKDGANSMVLRTGVAYPASLTRHIVSQAKDKAIVKAQLADKTVDVFNGKPFGDKSEGEKLNFQDMISIDTDMLTNAFGFQVDESQLAGLLEDFIGALTDVLGRDRVAARADFVSTLEKMAHEMLDSYAKSHADAEGNVTIPGENIITIVEDFLATNGASSQISSLASKYKMNASDLKSIYQPLLVAMLGQITLENSMQPETPAPTLPDVTIPDFTLPDVDLPDFTLPDVDLPDFTLPDVDLPDFTLPDVDLPDFTLPDVDLPDFTLPDMDLPDFTMPSLPDFTWPTAVSHASSAKLVPLADTNTWAIGDNIFGDILDFEFGNAKFHISQVDSLVKDIMASPLISASSELMAASMLRGMVEQRAREQLDELSENVMEYLGGAMRVDQQMIANAFKFNFTEEELMRLMQSMSTPNRERSADTNLLDFGYADLDSPTMMSIYLTDFEGKEVFLNFLDNYNAQMESAGKEDQIISYTDMTGMLMSSVRTIIDSVSYVLIAFVAVSLIVSSIMIGIITYISVMERTKEIGVLRAMGASKRNISQVFNAETFIIGLCSGFLGIGITLALLIPINQLIHHLTNNPNLSAQLPVTGAVILIILSMLLTVIGGLIPSQKAAKKDPVIALRTE